jgi:putative transposase
VRKCTLPSIQEMAILRHIDIHQSQQWTWIHRRADKRRLTARARARLAMLEWHHGHGGNISRTCRRFGVSRPTVYRWLRRYYQGGPASLEDRSHRPHRVRTPSWNLGQVESVLALRERHPRWGKHKLLVLLAREGVALSSSMIGRILRRLKLNGQLREAGPRRLARRCGPRPYATRKPKDYVIERPGDLLQVDTLDIRPRAGQIFKQLSVIDVFSRCAAAEVGFGATASTMTCYLDRILERLPFRVRAIQIDGGSEFKAEFELYCQRRGVRVFVLPPRSPKLNGCVERLQRTFTEEHYECTDVPLRVADLAAALAQFEHTYNHIRPHQALGYLTPAEYLAQEAAA